MIPTMTTPLPTKQPTTTMWAAPSASDRCSTKDPHLPPTASNWCCWHTCEFLVLGHSHSASLRQWGDTNTVELALPLPPQPPTLSQHLGIHHQPDHPVEQSNGVAPVIAYYGCWAKESCCWCCMFTRPPLRLRGRFFFWFLHSLYVWNAQAFTTVFSSLHASPSPPPSTHYMAPWPRSFLPSLRFIMASVLLLLQLPLLF